MKIEHKLQIDVIKGERIYYKDLGKLIFIADGHVGVYLSERELKIDKSRMIEIKNQNEQGSSWNPENLLIERIAAKETKAAIKTNNGFAIKLKATEKDLTCYVQEKFLKLFNGYSTLHIKDPKSPVLVYKYGAPYGIIMPLNVTKEE